VYIADMEIAEFLDLIDQTLKSTTNRVLFGVVGKPGAGKSTVVESVKKRFLGQEVAIIPMDGYHLSDEILISQGKRDRKGAPDTFDAARFTKLLQDVKVNSDSEIRFPIFHREIEASVEDEGVIPPEAKVVITEGYYLLSTEHGWVGVKELLDQSFYIVIDDEIRLQRLIDRHIRYGKSPEEAKAWSLGSDETNARFIATTKDLASAIINL
jgi:pantothenate kinase